MKTIFIALLGIFSIEHARADLPDFLQDSLFEKVGIENNIDPLLLYSITIVESGASEDSKHIAPTPLVIRSPEGAEYFDKKEQAEKRLSLLTSKYKNIDVGICQRNLSWNPHKTPEIFLDPETCLSWAAGVINNNFKVGKRKNMSLAGSIGLYHSWEDKLAAETYGLRVLKIYQNLKNQ